MRNVVPGLSGKGEPLWRARDSVYDKELDGLPRETGVAASMNARVDLDIRSLKPDKAIKPVSADMESGLG